MEGAFTTASNSLKAIKREVSCVLLALLAHDDFKKRGEMLMDLIVELGQ